MHADQLVDYFSLRSRTIAPRPAATAPRVLMLTSGLGVGHVRAAQAIEAALALEQVQIRNVDLWSLMNPGVAAVAHKAYLQLVLDHPHLYERLYQLDEQTWRQILDSEAGPPRQVLEVLELISEIAAAAADDQPKGGRYASDRLLMGLLCTALPYGAASLAGNGARARLALMKWAWLRLIRRLEPLVREYAPDVIVATQMIPAAMVSYLKQKRRIDVPLVGVVTDFGVHDFWKQPGINAYCVAHESIAGPLSVLCNADVEAVGVPLMPGFAAPLSQPEARRRLALPQDQPQVLVLGGGLGLSVDQAAARLLEQRSDLRLMVMPGRNTAARAALEQLSNWHLGRMQVCDWTDNMDIYLRASDIVVGKPGGITVAEALACGRPLLATRSLGGQEGFNVRFLEQHEVGGLVSERELLPKVLSLLRNRDRLQDMQRRAALLGQREGAERVAQLTLELAATQRNELAAGL